MNKPAANALSQGLLNADPELKADLAKRKAVAKRLKESAAWLKMIDAPETVVARVLRSASKMYPKEQKISVTVDELLAIAVAGARFESNG